ncbi:MAG: hypothetical protein GWO44_06670, partial [Thermoplasmata archaeon]|nr:hypothetical protein [Thermoplasmata archaeon]NIY02963.1 hypothetical protein [Thermoplasmata archaeon]
MKLSFAAQQGLKDLLGSFNLGYLFPLIKEEPWREIEQARYVVVSKGEEQLLILKREVREVLRDAIKEYIDDYNQASDLTGEERKEYPLDEGSDYESGFLRGLIDKYVLFNLDGTELPLDGYERERFYYLGHPEIDPNSV